MSLTFEVTYDDGDTIVDQYNDGQTFIQKAQFYDRVMERYAVKKIECYDGSNLVATRYAGEKYWR